MFGRRGKCQGREGWPGGATEKSRAALAGSPGERPGTGETGYWDIYVIWNAAAENSGYGAPPSAQRIESRSAGETCTYPVLTQLRCVPDTVQVNKGVLSRISENVQLPEVGRLFTPAVKRVMRTSELPSRSETSA